MELKVVVRVASAFRIAQPRTFSFHDFQLISPCFLLDFNMLPFFMSCYNIASSVKLITKYENHHRGSRLIHFPELF